MKVAACAALLAVCIRADAIAEAVTDGIANTSTEPQGKHSLQVSTTAATVAIAPRKNRRNTLRLPAIDYVFQLSTHCAEPFSAGSVSLTIADSRQSLNAKQLQDENMSSELRVTVPANQIAPVSVAGFCVDQSLWDEDATAAEGRDAHSLTLPAALSVNASLLCIRENGSDQEIVYTSAPLDVTLICERNDGPAE